MIDIKLTEIWSKKPSGLITAIVLLSFAAGFYLILDNRVKFLAKEQKTNANSTVEVSKESISEFRKFKEQISTDIDKLKTSNEATQRLLNELNHSVNRKINILIDKQNSNAEDIKLMIDLVDENYWKMHDIYSMHIDSLEQLNEHYKLTLDYVIDTTRHNIGVKPIK